MSNAYPPELYTPEINRAIAAWRPSPIATTTREWQERCQRMSLAKRHRHAQEVESLIALCRSNPRSAREALCGTGRTTAARPGTASRTPAAPQLEWFDGDTINDHGFLRKAEPEEISARYSR